MGADYYLARMSKTINIQIIAERHLKQAIAEYLTTYFGSAKIINLCQVVPGGQQVCRIRSSFPVWA